MASSDDQSTTPAEAGSKPLANAKSSGSRFGSRSWRILGSGDRSAQASADDGGSGRGHLKLRKLKLAVPLALALLTAAPAGNVRADDAAAQQEILTLAHQGSAGAQYALALALARNPITDADFGEAHW